MGSLVGSCQKARTRDKIQLFQNSAMKNLGLVMLLAAALFAVVVNGRGRVGGVRFGGYRGRGGNGWTGAWYEWLIASFGILIGLYIIIEAIKYCCCKKEEKKE